MKHLPILVQKEFFQMWRDPSAFILAFIMPAVMMLLFGFCINMDTSTLRVLLVAEDESPPVHGLIEAMQGSDCIEVQRLTDREQALQMLHTGGAHAMLVIPQQAAREAVCRTEPELLMATDGTVPNTARFAAIYLQSICERWQAEQGQAASLDLRTVYRFNPAAESLLYIISGACAMVLAMVGTFLTAMVVAREWERGTMETILATSTIRAEFLLSKLIPYFLLGLGALSMCLLLASLLFRVPLHAPLWAFYAVASLFLLCVLSMGLLISTAVKSQYTASLISLMLALLPTMLLSGFVFELSGIPALIDYISYLIPARYFCPALTSLFLSGGNASVLTFNVGMLALSAVCWFGLVLLIPPKKLDS